MLTIRIKTSYYDWQKTTASYVVGHAKRRARRGKNPSMPYRGVKNPRMALILAIADLEKQRRESMSKNIWDLTNLAMREADSKGKSVFLTFRGAMVGVRPNANQVVLVDQLRGQVQWQRRTEW
jgi:hypothetical protein